MNEWNKSKDFKSKRCCRCKQTLSIDKFSNSYKSADNKHGYCKKCHSEYNTKWVANRVDNRKDVELRIKRTYGINLTEYDSMYTKQNGLCAICKNPESIKTGRRSINRLAIDHCHTTGKIRGLLCQRCNTGLGRLEKYIDRAKQYLLGIYDQLE